MTDEERFSLLVSVMGTSAVVVPSATSASPRASP